MSSVAIDFEAEGLLEGLEGKARQDRLELLQQLETDGYGLDELRTAVEEERLSLLLVDRVLAGEGRRYTLREVAQEAGVEIDFLVRQRQAMGLPVPEIDEPDATEEDIEAARLAKAFRELGLPEEGMLEITRVIGMSMSQVAAASRRLTGDAFVEAGDTEREAGLRIAEAARTLAPMLMPILQYVYSSHLRQQVARDVISRARLESGEAPGAEPITACFADLVGFTRLGERLSVHELGALTGRLGELAAEAAAPPVRLIKLIGDAAMLVSPDLEPLLDAALGLVEAADSEEEEGFPQIRAGVASGPALARAGDWYGRPVNLASRITSIAYPGSVLCAESVREEAGDGYSWSFAGERRLKGIEGQVKLFRARKSDAPSED
jgi:adenylate cyclase